MATVFKQVKDNANSRIATLDALNNTTASIVVSVTAATGAKFPTPGNSFRVTIWDDLTYADPGDDPAMEQALCTARSTDALTLSRSSAIAHPGNPAIALLGTAADVSDLQVAVNAAEATIVSHTASIATNTSDITTLKQDNLNGWLPANETWAYASASGIQGVITVPTDGTLKYSVGDRFMLTQTTIKYFVVIAVTATTVTVTGGTDYTLANAAITANYYSKAITPVGFPGWFAYSPTFTGFSSPPAGVGTFRVIGRVCDTNFAGTANGTSNSTGMTATLPITAVTRTSAYWDGFGAGGDNGSGLTIPVLVRVASAGTVATIYKDFAASNWTATGSKGASFRTSYEI